MAIVLILPDRQEEFLKIRNLVLRDGSEPVRRS
jgi:hypothetical protein